VDLELGREEAPPYSLQERERKVKLLPYRKNKPLRGERYCARLLPTFFRSKGGEVYSYFWGGGVGGDSASLFFEKGGDLYLLERGQTMERGVRCPVRERGGGGRT